MNREWMRDRLEGFATLCEAYEFEARTTSEYSSTQREIAAEMATREPAIREILKRLDPGLDQAELRPMYTGGVTEAFRAIRLALGILRDQDEWKANLEPDAPSLVADQFHPRIWGAASGLWDTGMYRVAVEQAAVALSAHIAAKAKSHLAERELVNEVLAPAHRHWARRACTCRETRPAGPGDPARTGCITWRREPSPGSGMSLHMTRTNGPSRSRSSTSPSCPSSAGGPTRPSFSPDPDRQQAARAVRMTSPCPGCASTYVVTIRPERLC